MISCDWGGASAFIYGKRDAVGPRGSVPQAAGRVGEGRLPLKVPGLAVLLAPSRSVAAPLPARVRHQHFVREGVQGVIHDLHLHRVVGRQVPQSACEEAGLFLLPEAEKGKDATV